MCCINFIYFSSSYVITSVTVLLSWIPAIALSLEICALAMVTGTGKSGTNI